MTFTDNLLSFDYGINAVCHMEQEDPRSSCHALHIHTFLQLQTKTFIYNFHDEKSVSESARSVNYS